MRSIMFDERAIMLRRRGQKEYFPLAPCMCALPGFYYYVISPRTVMSGEGSTIFQLCAVGERRD